MIYKYSFKLLLLVISIMFIFWTFNHVNPWIAILIGFFGLTYLVNSLTNFFKNK